MEEGQHQQRKAHVGERHLQREVVQEVQEEQQERLQDEMEQHQGAALLQEQEHTAQRGEQQSEPFGNGVRDGKVLQKYQEKVDNMVQFANTATPHHLPHQAQHQSQQQVHDQSERQSLQHQAQHQSLQHRLELHPAAEQGHPREHSTLHPGAAEQQQHNPEMNHLSQYLEVVVILEGVEPLTSHPTQARYSYTTAEIEFGKSFPTCVFPKKSNLVIDYLQFQRTI
ncbi:unnamed protein product [Amoebophrya sp. A25]|nr:unnamed protein product [Amoebophrya sp. A25]|eukprot:GSA25T00008374001.1